MRILSALIKALIVVGLIVGVGFLIAREVMVWQATSDLSNSAKKAVDVSRTPSQYYDMCRKKGNSRETLAQTVFQLRFTSDKDYQVEVVCPQFPSDPILIQQKTLPRFVTKVDGSSGFILGEYDSNSVTLEIFGRQQSVYVDNYKVKNQSGAMMLDPGPVTTCQGWGYECCQAETTKGTGAIIPSVSDCPRSCFESCLPRPVILSFTSDPFMDIKTRVAEVSKGQEVSFSWVSEAGQSQSVSGTVDFGDGQTQNFVDLTGSVSHQYRCLESSCYYQAEIKIVDDQGIESASTGITKVGVRIK